MLLVVRDPWGSRKLNMRGSCGRQNAGALRFEDFASWLNEQPAATLEFDALRRQIKSPCASPATDYTNINKCECVFNSELPRGESLRWLLTN